MLVHAAVAEALRGLGVDTVFGLMGDGNMHTLVDFVTSGGRYVGSVHEAGAVSMADGYARVGGRLGVASITHGPGVSNALTALTEAVRARSPLLVLTGDTPARPDHLQRLDLRAAAGLTGASYHRVLRPSDAVGDLVAAARSALATGRPVLFDVPVDLQKADFDAPVTVRPLPARQAVEPDPDALDRALGAIVSARRPVIVAGRGAAGARMELVELADLIGAPLGTTLLGKDLFRGHPLDLGVIGTLSTAITTETVLAADCVIVFGAGLNRYTTAEGSLLDGKAVVRIDVDPAHPDSVVGDAAATARAMATQLREVGYRFPASRTSALSTLATALSSHSPREEFADRSGSGTIDARTAVIRLDELLPEERVVVTDTGRFVYAPWRYLHVPEPSAFAHTLNFAAIGLGLATAIGAAAASPDRLTVAVIGDGGGMMGITELITASHAGLPLLVVVCNDGAYGMEYRGLELAGCDTAPSLLAWPDLADVARPLGADAVTVRDLAELEEAVASLKLPLARPMVLELKNDPAVDVGDFA